MNDDNLKGHGFHERTASEQREIASLGGKKSGEVRRKKANFRKTLNALLTAEVEIDNISDFFRGNGIDSTYESAINFAMIQKALQGDIKAYNAIRDVIGQTTKSDQDIKEQEARIDSLKSKVKVENETMELKKKEFEKDDW